MTISDCKKRINNALKKLNAMDNKLQFSFREEEYGAFIEACRTDGHNFGVYEPSVLFTDYCDIPTAYVELMSKVEFLEAGTELNNPKAYHNLR